MQHHLAVDIETRASVDIKTAGAYRYAQSEDFQILLIAYKYDDEPVRIMECREHVRRDENGVFSVTQELQQFMSWLKDPEVTKSAYNAAFEWTCLNRANLDTPLEQWVCTMAHGLYLGYPAGLASIGDAIGLPQDKKKLMTGNALIKLFCTPAKATKKNGGRKWVQPEQEPEKWDLFMEYCVQDVVTESELRRRLSRFPMPQSELDLWRQDVRMNARGVRCDRALMDGAIYIDDVSNERLTERAKHITGLSNPNSIQQLLGWMEAQGCPMGNLTKATVSKALDDKTGDLPDDVREVLMIRQQMGKISVKKYSAMKATICTDDRIRGLSQYYGASRTGRYSGRLVQLQNLARNHIGALDTARGLVKKGDYDAVRMIYGNVPDTLSQLVRTAFIPSEGRKLVVADFSAIEARVIAWLAGETWVNEVFATHGKIYEATAAQMFHVPIETIVKGHENYDLRQKGKVATLALGYQGGVNALTAMGALDMGIAEDDLPDIVNRWREANKNIVNLWGEMQEAALRCVENGTEESVKNGRIVFRLESDLVYGQSYLTMQLPSGRKLFYCRPSIKLNRYDRPAIHFYDTDVNKKWVETSTYGGKLTENAVQSIARDCLTESLRRVEAKGLDVVFHVHDEVVVDSPTHVSVDEVCDLMSQPIEWAQGLILKAAGFEGDYYKKD